MNLQKIIEQLTKAQDTGMVACRVDYAQLLEYLKELQWKRLELWTSKNDYEKLEESVSLLSNENEWLRKSYRESVKRADGLQKELDTLKSDNEELNAGLSYQYDYATTRHGIGKSEYIIESDRVSLEQLKAENILLKERSDDETSCSKMNQRLVNEQAKHIDKLKWHIEDKDRSIASYKRLTEQLETASKIQIREDDNNEVLEHENKRLSGVIKYIADYIEKVK